MLLYYLLFDDFHFFLPTELFYFSYIISILSGFSIQMGNIVFLSFHFYQSTFFTLIFLSISLSLKVLASSVLFRGGGGSPILAPSP